MNCATCKSEFIANKRRFKFCSTKCIRYSGPDSLKKGDFWKNATYEEKMERLIHHYNKKVIKKEGCWDWNGYKSIGYGTLRYDGKLLHAHRASWIINNGNIPAGLQVLHKCDNPSCSNPEHLFLGTQKDNIRDMMSKNRMFIPKGETHYASKLKPNDVLKIRELLADSKLSQKKIGDLYGVCRGTILDIKNNRIWRDI